MIITCPHCNTTVERDIQVIYCSQQCRKRAAHKRWRNNKPQHNKSNRDPVLIERNCPTPWKVRSFASLQEADQWLTFNKVILRPYPCSCGLWHLSSRRRISNPLYLERHREQLLL